MVTTRYSNQQGSKSREKVTLQAIALTNIKTVHQTSLYIESNLDRLGLLSHDQRSQQQTGSWSQTSAFPSETSRFKPVILAHGGISVRGLRENRNAPRPSEHPPVRGKKMSKRLGGIKGCKYKTSSWHLNGFPYGGNIGSTV